MPRRLTGQNTFDAAIDRMVEIYEAGHRVVCSFSAGKDSGVCVEICVIAATMTGRLPVEVIMRDEEIMFPGTFEYAARMAERDDIDFNWIYACQPVINCFNRAAPYFWVFDPLLDPEEWVRQPPAIARQIPEMDIGRMTIPDRFPPAEGKNLYAVIGLRTAESRGRMYGLFSSKGYVTKPNEYGVLNARPIYDWSDGDIWKSIKDNHWDYNEAYDVMARHGVPRTKLRIAPPSMNRGGVKSLAMAQRAWPNWFDRVCRRLPGIRSGANFGERSVTPLRRLDETWEQCFNRVCIKDAPEWIADRAREAARVILSTHKHHSTSPLPEVTPCYNCAGNMGSWKRLAFGIFGGDPFGLASSGLLPAIEPEFFRAGAGTWGGKPTF